MAVQLERLSSEMARGGGGSVTSLAALLGCPKETRPLFAAMTHRAYPRLWPGNDITARGMLSRLYREMATRPILVAECRFV